MDIRAEQWYIILNGQAIMKVGDEESEAGIGTLIFIPHNTGHSYKVVGDEPLRILNVASWLPGPESVTSLVSGGAAQS
jgi:mannose-6-phosphate isomerase-like protein (cupin superfamily)